MNEEWFLFFYFNFYIFLIFYFLISLIYKFLENKINNLEKSMYFLIVFIVGRLFHSFMMTAFLVIVIKKYIS